MNMIKWLMIKPTTKAAGATSVAVISFDKTPEEKIEAVAKALNKKVEDMPTNACQFFYECENCKTVLKPKKGDCCVYCSYGTVACPPIQEGKNCC